MSGRTTRAVALFFAAACSKPTAPTGDAHAGESRYAELCASCHGPTARGGSGPALAPWSRSEASLVSIIEQRMPKSSPGTCAGTCARDVAAFILSLGGAPSCDAVTAAPRQLRLLTRFEYANTVRDLFGGGAACAVDADCRLDRESCTAGRCVADGCELQTFVWPAGGKKPGSVFVSGSFNGWPASAAAGGWAMQYATKGDLYYVKHALPAGQHQYKFVVDGQWLADPGDPVHAPDGFGGENSYLDKQCSQDADLVTGAFPPETRPKGYGFDNDAPAGLVSSTHADAYFDAAHTLAETAAGLPSFVPCAPSAVCARQLVTDFGRKAFRRPLTPEEVDRYTAQLAMRPSFDEGVKTVVETMLSSPYFLYRSELGEPGADGRWHLTGYEVASALSYTLWSSMPDEALFAAAAAGELSSPDHVREQARRMLMDARARTTLRRFALQWLGVERVRTGDKSPTLFPGFTLELREAMAQETAAVFERAVFDEGGRLDPLLTADWSVVDPALARFYGVTVGGSGPQRITLPPERAAGVLGHGSVLASTAHSDQSSPILRGLFVRQNLLCHELGTPPPNAAAKLPHVDETATTRERFSQHSADPACASCHTRIDPIGFGFEHFDAIGGWRDRENGKPIDASGDLVDAEALGDGTHAAFSTLPELGGLLAGGRQVKRCFATQVFRWSGGRLEGDADRCAVRSLDAAFEASGFSLPELLVQAVSADAFLARREEVQQ